VAQVRAAAHQGADLRRRRSRTGHRSAWPTSPTTRRPYTRVGARRAPSRRVGRPTCWDWRSARRSPCATGCHVSNRRRNLRNPGGPATTRSASASSAGGVSAERTATFNPPATPDSSVAAANAGRSPRSSPATTTARAPDSAMIRRHRVTLIAADRRPKLPDQLAQDDLQPVPVGDLSGSFVDRPGPPRGVGHPPCMDGDRIHLVLQVGAAVAERWAVTQLLPCQHHGGPGRLQQRIDQDLPVADLLQAAGRDTERPVRPHVRTKSWPGGPTAMRQRRTERPAVRAGRPFQGGLSSVPGRPRSVQVCRRSPSTGPQRPPAPPAGRRACRVRRPRGCPRSPLALQREGVPGPRVQVDGLIAD
jgi:hypothetical protein